MIKYFCDRCGKECDKDVMTIQRFAYDGLGATIAWIRNDHLCKECIEKFMEIHDKLEHEDDIFDMSDEDIELCLFNEDEIRVEIDKCTKRMLDLYERLYSIQKLKRINQHKN